MPPDCTTPISASVNVAHQGVQLVWNPVGGATGYDVYFGNTSNPPLVSSNQAGTTYSNTNCMPPNTTYY